MALRHCLKDKIMALRHCFKKGVTSGKALDDLPFVWFCKDTKCGPETLVEAKSKGGVYGLFKMSKLAERHTWKLVNAHLLHPILFCFALSIPTIDNAAVVVTSVADDVTHLELDRHCLVGPPYLSADRFIGLLIIIITVYRHSS